MHSTSSLRCGSRRPGLSPGTCKSCPLVTTIPMPLALPSAIPFAPSSKSIRSLPSRSRDLVRRLASPSQSLPQIAQDAPSTQNKKRPLRVLIAGAGIGGLVLAVALIKKGFEVQVLERDLTAIRGEGKYRGPIQIQSNALGALEAIDPEIANEIMAVGCITGDRINGLCDGVTGDWYVKFDTFHPAADKGLPVTRVISRVSLQNILAKAVLKLAGPNAIIGNSHVVGYSETASSKGVDPSVSVTLDNGKVFTGDILVGADGIWSKIRKQMIGESKPSYSEYTCYTGISDFTPADIDVVGYRVFLGNCQYFVSSDVGGGKQQWYAFHKEPAGGSDAEGTRKRRLLEIFGHWSDNVVDLIKATPEGDILRRDIFDRPPVFKWSEGRTCLLGDAVHAMQPNLGQGGCMAIEDAYSLAEILGESLEAAKGVPGALNTQHVFGKYQGQRMLRASTIHGMAGMAAFMASNYKAYLGEGLPGPLDALTQLKIPHPGRLAGQMVMKLTMPHVLGWVLGGNVAHLERSRRSQCRIADQPHAFSESQFPRFMVDDESVTRATTTNADWLLVAQREASSFSSSFSSRVDVNADSTSTSEVKGLYIRDRPAVVGGGHGASDGSDLVAAGPGVAPSKRYARVWRESVMDDAVASGRSFDHFIQDMTTAAKSKGEREGTWLNGRRLAPGEKTKLKPGDAVAFGRGGEVTGAVGGSSAVVFRDSNVEVFRVKLQHVSLRNEALQGSEYTTLLVGQKKSAREERGAEGHGEEIRRERSFAAELPVLVL